ncbi:MlaD family protein [Pseudogemmatithrix spongiicola]|uniref:MlaD family protein n=1 Tax=Pseudogemmatithrix spongiicola TaxID=3062599 RepID=A0AA49JXL8_9BACT|nr:MlaD family protein [Gemmatimonadaceae bacterium 'strain 138']WKW13891.1 MlaD family protein [Gemmatimonadaceae bacterium 'strain 318']
MSKRRNDWLVGLTVLSTMLVLIAGTMYLQQADLGARRTSISARFRDVGNMQVGNGVVIRGVNAGRIERISLAEKGWVVAEMKLNEGITLPSDPVVLIQAATLFGEWQAVITARSAAPGIREVAMQLEDTVGAPAATLPGGVLPDIAQLTSVAGGIAGNVASVAERVRVAFDDSAARELRGTIRNFNAMSTQLTRTVREQSRNLDSVAVDVRVGANELARGMGNFQRSIARLDSATSRGEVERIIGETQQAAINLRQVSERLATMSASLERSEASLRGALGKADTILGRIERGEGSLGLMVNNPSLYNNSDSLVIDLRSLIADFRRNPKRYINLSIF